MEGVGGGRIIGRGWMEGGLNEADGRFRKQRLLKEGGLQKGMRSESILEGGYEVRVFRRGIGGGSIVGGKGKGDYRKGMV